MNGLQPVNFCGLTPRQPFRSSADLQGEKSSTPDALDELWNPVDSLECLKKGGDQRVEIMVLFS